jgi:predicted nucleic acid-binding protein
MKYDCLLDTNILIYAALGRFKEPSKYEISRKIIAEKRFCISAQVLQEFYVNATKKAEKPIGVDEIDKWINSLRGKVVCATDMTLVVDAIQFSKRYITSYWDAAVIVAAKRSDAPIVYTEDLNHNQLYDGVRVINPFI